ncbi:hypothetical protein ACQJBY_059316 [Aegilops geniculata]
MNTHEVSEMRFWATGMGWGRSCGATLGGSIYSARRMLSKCRGKGATRWADKAEVPLRFPDAQQRCDDSHMRKPGATTARCTEVARLLYSDDF